MKMKNNHTGVVRFSHVFTAYLDGKRIADFNSKGAAQAGIEVERRRKNKQTISIKNENH